MSALFNEASLVLVPSGYKAGKVYSQVPTNGDGDLSFTRSNDTATRVNSDGLIEKVRTNSQTYSQDFTNVTYKKDAGVTITSTNNTSPSGALDATKISVTNSGRIYSDVASGTWCTSVFLKAGTFAYFELAGKKIDLNLGTMVGGTIENYGNGWYRVTGIVTTIRPFQIIAYPNSSYTAHTTSGDYFIWGVQSELNATYSTEYIPTTSAAVSVGMTANVPRLDYTGGGCPKLLLEPQRTNLVTYSEEFNNWLIPPTFTTIETASLKGSIIFSNFGSAISQGITLTSNADTTISVFAKKSNWNFLQIRTVNFDASASARKFTVLI